MRVGLVGKLRLVADETVAVSFISGRGGTGPNSGSTGVAPARLTVATYYSEHLI